MKQIIIIINADIVPFSTAAFTKEDDIMRLSGIMRRTVSASR